MSSDDTEDDTCSTIIWMIENFSYWEKIQEGKPLLSPVFIVNSLEDAEWNLQLVASGEQNETDLGIFLGVCITGDETHHIVKEYEMTLLDVDGLPLEKVRSKNTFRAGIDWGRSKFVTLQKLTESKNIYLPGDTLTVRCVIWNKGQTLQQSEVCHVRTRLEVKQGTFKWWVKDFSPLQPKIERSIQIKFPCSSTVLTSTLSSYFDAKNTGRFRFAVTQFDAKLQNIFAFKMCVIDPEGKMVEFVKGEHVFKIRNGPQCGLFRSFIDKEELIANKELYSSKIGLILQCEVNMCSGGKIESIRYGRLRYIPNPPLIVLKPYSASKQHASCPIQNDLKSLRKEGFLSDVSLCADGHEFPAHRSILGARSPVFRAMFSSEMKEKTGSLVDILDFGAETVQYMLQYFYSDTVEDLQWNAMSQLFAAADKYQVQSLKMKCSLILKNKISASNACDLLILSYLHLDPDLKTTVQDYITDHEIMRMDEWKRVEMDYPLLAIETWRYMYFSK